MKRTILILTFALILATLAGCGRNREEALPAPAATVAAPVETETGATTTEEATATSETLVEEGAAADAEIAAADAAESPVAASDGAESPMSPLDAPESPLATPVVVEPPSLPTETQDGTGAFIGRIMINNAAGVRPVQNMKVALADVLRDEDGTPLIAGYEAAVAPKTATDELGRFAMNNIEPGTYAIILDAVITSVLLADPATGDPILIEITDGDVTDIGRVDYESLALPGYLE